MLIEKYTYVADSQTKDPGLFSSHDYKYEAGCCFLGFLDLGAVQHVSMRNTNTVQKCI